MNNADKLETKTTEAPGAVAGPNRNVLLVDDDKFLLDLYSMKFNKLGYTVQSCTTVNDALHVLRNGFSADAIVFDLRMPERDGFSFLQALSAENLGKGAVRIAITNESDDSIKKKAADLGTDKLIVKAFTIPSEVVDFVAEEIKNNPKIRSESKKT